MILCLANVLTEEDLAAVVRVFDRAPNRDGRTTAGWHARLVKDNRQLDPGDPAVAEARDRVRAALRRHEVFQAAVLPRHVRPPLFAFYEPGMGYGAHVDDALMGDPPVRSDVSVTVFLAPPESYDGGELVLETSAGDQAYKLGAGQALIYPSTTLHRVEPVTRGRRAVAVTWVQSLVRDAAQREILFDLDTARRDVFKKDGKTPTFDLLSKTYANLLRRWSEV